MEVGLALSPCAARAVAAAGTTFVAANAFVSGGTAVTATPAGAVQTGDLLIAVLGQDNAAATLGAPAGWTAIGTQQTVGASGVAAAWRFVHDGTASYQFAGDATGSMCCGLYACRGQGAAPIGDANLTVIDPASTAYATGSITPAAANSRLVFAALAIGALTAFTPPAGMTERLDGNGGGHQAEFADAVQAGTSPVSATATCAATRSGTAVLVAVTPA